ncbi:hypothetical protein [Galenea microaerophila]
MSTIVLWIIIAALAIIILGKLPGLDHVLKPLFESVFTLLTEIFKQAFIWVMFVIRHILVAHRDFFYHLTNPRHKILPEERIKEINRRGGID